MHHVLKEPAGATNGKAAELRSDDADLRGEMAAIKDVFSIGLSHLSAIAAAPRGGAEGGVH